MLIDAKPQTGARRWRYIVRGFGWFFFLFGLGCSVFLFITFANPDSSITVNGVPTNDPKEKLGVALFPLMHALIGALLVFAPARYIDASYFWQEDLKRRLLRLLRGR